MTELLLTGLKVSVAALILGIGLGEPAGDVLYVWRRPGLLARSLLAMYVLVPLVAVAMAKVLPLTIGAKAALLLLAVSAGAPLLPRRLAAFGAGPYLFSLVFTSSLLALVVVPLSFRALTAFFEVPVETPALAVAAVIGKSFLLPLAVGMLVRAVLPERIRERVVPVLTGAAAILLVICTALLLATNLPLLLEARLSGIAALVVLMAISLAIGHALGGPEPGERSALAVACATRHLGVALLVASTLAGPRLVVVIGIYIVVSLAVTTPYLRWRRHALVARPAR
ncbi:MAG: hypothetical protein AB1938_11500 [Myxococcota bacterium]